MNEKGQFLLYDALFAFIILILVVLLSLHMLSNQTAVYENTNSHELPLDVLNNLDSVHCESNTLLHDLSIAIDTNNTNLRNKCLNLSVQIISQERYGYKLSDLTSNQTLLDSHVGNKKIYSGRKLVNNHVFELDYYA